MDVQFTTENVGKALMLMLSGMVGIFIVMVVILGVVVLLNKTTGDHTNHKDGQTKNR